MINEEKLMEETERMTGRAKDKKKFTYTRHQSLQEDSSLAVECVSVGVHKEKRQKRYTNFYFLLWERSRIRYSAKEYSIREKLGKKISRSEYLVYKSPESFAGGSLVQGYKVSITL